MPLKKKKKKNVIAGKQIWHSMEMKAKFKRPWINQGKEMKIS